MHHIYRTYTRMPSPALSNLRMAGNRNSLKDSSQDFPMPCWMATTWLPAAAVGFALQTKLPSQAKFDALLCGAIEISSTHIAGGQSEFRQAPSTFYGSRRYPNGCRRNAKSCWILVAQTEVPGGAKEPRVTKRSPVSIPRPCVRAQLRLVRIELLPALFQNPREIGTFDLVITRFCA